MIKFRNPWQGSWIDGSQDKMFTWELLGGQLGCPRWNFWNKSKFSVFERKCFKHVPEWDINHWRPHSRCAIASPAWKSCQLDSYKQRHNLKYPRLFQRIVLIAKVFVTISCRNMKYMVNLKLKFIVVLAGGKCKKKSGADEDWQGHYLLNLCNMSGQKYSVESNFQQKISFY